MAATTTILHRVPFYETDAMAIVHHANYVRWLELARVAWMDEHDRPYSEYVAAGTHFATTRVDIRYLRATAFDDRVAITVWLSLLRRASLTMSYEITRGDERIATAQTEHALVDLQGKVRRLPPERRESLALHVQENTGQTS